MRSLNFIPPIDPEELARERLTALLDVYREAENELMGVIHQTINASTRRSARWRAVTMLRQVRNTIDRINRQIERQAPRMISTLYEEGARETARTAELLGVTGGVALGNRIHQEAAEAISRGLVEDLSQASEAMWTEISGFIRATQQKILQENVISRRIATGLVTGQGGPQVSGRLYEDFRNAMADEQFIQAGARRYTPGVYSDLVTRTRMREAVTWGRRNTSLDLGLDLVQIDVHGDACPQCQMRMGRVYSQSGAATDFPQLLDHPPYHPNCRCNMFPVTEYALLYRNEYDVVSRMSMQTPNTLPSKKEAMEWLMQNPTYRVATYNDYLNVLGKPQRTPMQAIRDARVKVTQ